MKSSPHILVIDDENHICESCDRIFTNAGYRVDTNISATKGFRQALSNPYDAIILDLNLVESDGLKLLYGIRKSKPDVPVVIITGYPSEDSRRLSSTLGVTDYITKPFGPSEILEPVEKVVSHREVPETDLSDPEPVEIREINNHFHHSSWFYKIPGSLVRVGGYLPDLSNNCINSIRLPEPDSVVYRGLPIVEVTLNNGLKQTIPSSVSGRVMATNGHLRDHYYILEKNIHSKNWIAVVDPFHLEQDLRVSETRSILVLTHREREQNEFVIRFQEQGYSTQIVENIKEVLNILARDSIRVLFIDAQKFGYSGPKYVKKINRLFPDVKIIVFNEPDKHAEKQYRNYRILYYGVNPISNNEMVDLLHCAFKDPTEMAMRDPRVFRFLPEAINRISLTNKHGTKVTLFACDGILRHNNGLGYLISKELNKMEIPLWFHHTRLPKSFKELTNSGIIAKERNTCDRIIILQANELGMIPGNISRNMSEYSNENSEMNLMIYMNIQAGYGKTRSIDFDINTTLALKEQIMNELVSA